MATIKPLEGRTVHQIQSGQVIVDLCSVAKELVENSLDASATSIEVRFKNHGLDSIEVQDNGIGISKENYETIALKHYTSKLSSYEELSSLKTFGFRGEALSSLCALSKFQILTAQAEEAPKGIRLDFEISGKLKTTQVAPSPKGTTVAVENLFMNLPVRRRELEKNIKREYGKVLGVLQAYACISTDVKFSVSNVLAKGKKVMVFATRSNPTTRENIANIYGAKALTSLLSMNLDFEMQSSMQGSRKQTNVDEKKVHVLGHVSRPIVGEGRQAPDRQMFFVNSRPCGLPQVAKVFNEVYKSYNISQSPFVFANITLDTNAYDVNVSPDKRTILLHDQNILLESLKQSLIELFEGQDQTVPHSQHPTERLPSFKPLLIRRNSIKAKSIESGSSDLSLDASQHAGDEDASSHMLEVDSGNKKPASLIEAFVGRGTRERNPTIGNTWESGMRSHVIPKDKQKLTNKLGGPGDELLRMPVSGDGDAQEAPNSEFVSANNLRPIHGLDHRIGPQGPHTEQSFAETEEQSVHLNQVNEINTTSGVIQTAFDRMRPKRTIAEVATITIGSKITTAILGSNPSKRRKTNASSLGEPARETGKGESSKQIFGNSMRTFAAPGTQSPRSTNKQSDETHPLRLSDPEDEPTSPEDQSGELDMLSIAEESHEAAEASANNDTELAGDQVSSPPERTSDEASSDGEVLDEQRKKSRENAKVAKLIAQAEEKIATPLEDPIKRAQKVLRRSGYRDATTQLKQVIRSSIDRIDTQIQKLEALICQSLPNQHVIEPVTFADGDSAEARLSLTVCKEDFLRMRIVGQFNLGFILAFRPSKPAMNDSVVSAFGDELFIIDQHASDEKFNFERLQSSTVVQNQPLVKPLTLDLTAIEEEIIIENNDILLKNGFVVTIDTSGDEPVGRRCKLLSLPMSREVVFDMTDLEELIAMLAEAPSLPSTTTKNSSNRPTQMDNSSIPRPSKVRRLFAMRACRSSVMIGKSLSEAQMEKLVRHMSEIDKPWNCPHGRPTMRHVLGLGAWEGWREGMGQEGTEIESQDEVDWNGWFKRMENMQDGERGRHAKNINTDVDRDQAEEDGETNDETAEEEVDGYEDDEHADDTSAGERDNLDD